MLYNSCITCTVGYGHPLGGNLFLSNIVLVVSLLIILRLKPAYLTKTFWQGAAETVVGWPGQPRKKMILQVLRPWREHYFPPSIREIWITLCASKALLFGPEAGAVRSYHHGPMSLFDEASLLFSVLSGLSLGGIAQIGCCDATSMS